MKKLLIILLLLPCLLVAQSLEGQQIGGKTGLRTNSTIVNVGDNVGLSSPPSKTNYNVRASAFFLYVESLGKTLTSAQKSWYNDSLFVPLYNHGLIGLTRAGDSLVALYSFSLRWAGDSTVANINLLDPTGSYNCIHYGGVTYTDSGVVGNGTTGHLNTFFNPSADTSIAKRNSTSYMIVISSNVLEIGKMDMGIYGGTNVSVLAPLYLAGKAYCPVNDSDGEYVNNPDSSSKGIWISARVLSSYSNLYKNGAYFGKNTHLSTGVSNSNVLISAVGNNASVSRYTKKTYLYAAIGSGLSATLSQYLSDDLNNALKGAGYNVY